MRRPGLRLLVVTALAGCGSAHHAAIATACTGSARAIEAAARAAEPLAGGTPLSRCLADAQSGADVRDVAAVFLAAADDLAARATRDGGAARALGFLIGAGERGAARSGGTTAQLADRLGADARRVHETAPAMDRAVARGTTDGRAHG